MARKKRADAQAVLSVENGNALVLSNSVACAENRETCYSTYSTALYARLSVEDSGKEDGYSLENQISLLKGYIKSKEEFSLYNVYIDNGESGVRFDRPSFNQMIADMRAGKINCIIVKDLSRLGRNYLEAGNYMEKIFPFFHVRFISVMDDYDSLNGSAMDDGITIPLKNIINESYSKDISKKIGASNDARRKKGEYISSRPPYGYLLDPQKSGHLIVDHEVADNVQLIFNWRAEGMSPGAISRKLNAEQIPSPHMYFFEKGIVKSERNKNKGWTREIVDGLLRNPLYTGNMVTGKIRTSFADGMRRKKMPEESWFVTENTHEPIINRELFDKVQDMIKAAAQQYYSYVDSYEDFEVENIYRGHIRCGCCGAAMHMVRVQRKRKRKGLNNIVFYDCCNRGRLVSPECRATNIYKEVLDTIVLEEIQSFIRKFIDTEKVICRLNTEPDSVKKYQEFNNLIRKKQARISRLQGLFTELYEDLKEGLLEETEYLRMKSNYIEEKQTLEQEITELLKKQKLYTPNYSVSEKVHSVIQNYLSIKELSADLINTFIDRITVLDREHIQIKYTFQEEMDSLVKTIRSREEAGERYGFENE
ncbi:MAG: recombinase family protein [Lachnospiraceae bacterium]|nr:recombinase family protein [Lachnospiraceae bacterium]